MAKGQMRSNKEVRKPKADKKGKTAPAPASKASSEPIKPASGKK